MGAVLVSLREVTAGVGPPSAWGAQALWDREYGEARAIPSSLRSAPSRAFRRLEGALGDLEGRRVLDLGAGAGRHSLHAATRGATVHAVDSSDAACELHRRRAQRAGLGAAITVERARADVGSLPEGRYDLVIDSYVTCHLLSPAARLEVLDALLALLTPTGRLYTAGMGEEDTYYRRHRIGEGVEPIAVDPLNSVPKLLQPSDVGARDGEQVGRLVATTTERFVDVVGGRRERREVHASVLAR